MPHCRASTGQAPHATETVSGSQRLRVTTSRSDSETRSMGRKLLAPQTRRAARRKAAGRTRTGMPVRHLALQVYERSPELTPRLEHTRARVRISGVARDHQQGDPWSGSRSRLRVSRQRAGAQGCSVGAAFGWPCIPFPYPISRSFVSLVRSLGAAPHGAGSFRRATAVVTTAGRVGVNAQSTPVR
jgi:hypothetical protein